MPAYKSTVHLDVPKGHTKGLAVGDRVHAKVKGKVRAIRSHPSDPAQHSVEVEHDSAEMEKADPEDIADGGVDEAAEGEPPMPKGKGKKGKPATPWAGMVEGE